MLPDYQLEIADFCNIPIGNVKKLVPNFFDKEKYVIHYENLQIYLRLGWKLKINGFYSDKPTNYPTTHLPLTNQPTY